MFQQCYLYNIEWFYEIDILEYDENKELIQWLLPDFTHVYILEIK